MTRLQDGHRFEMAWQVLFLYDGYTEDGKRDFKLLSVNKTYFTAKQVTVQKKKKKSNSAAHYFLARQVLPLAELHFSLPVFNGSVMFVPCCSQEGLISPLRDPRSWNSGQECFHLLRYLHGISVKSILIFTESSQTRQESSKELVWREYRVCQIWEQKALLIRTK